MIRKPFTLQLVAAAALALGAAAPAHAGEALDIELPSMRTPIENSVPLLSPGQALVVMPAGGAPTREQVREELRQARANGTMSTFGEAGDTDAVLAAREQFNRVQAAEIRAAYAAEAARQQVLAQAEAQAERLAYAEQSAAGMRAGADATQADARPDAEVEMEMEMDPIKNPDRDPDMDPDMVPGVLPDADPATGMGAATEERAERNGRNGRNERHEPDTRPETDVRIEFIDTAQP